MSQIELMSSDKVLATLDTKTRLVTFNDKKENKVTISLTSLLQVTSNVMAEVLRHSEAGDEAIERGTIGN